MRPGIRNGRCGSWAKARPAATWSGRLPPTDLSDRIVVSGWEREPAAVLQQCDLFVLSSRFEGFPNALLEAMACGMAAVSFDCDSGPAEIIRNEIDGILVPPEDIARLATAMERLIVDEPLRHRLGCEAVRSGRAFWD